MKFGVGRIIAFLGSLIGLGRRRETSHAPARPGHLAVGWEPRQRRRGHKTTARCRLNRVAQRRAKREMEKASRRINRGHIQGNRIRLFGEAM